MYRALLIDSGVKDSVLGVDDGFVHCIPAGGGDTPVVRGVLVAVDADFSSLHFFVSIDTHGVFFFIVYISDCQCVIAILPTTNARQRYELFPNWQKKYFFSPRNSSPPSVRG